MHDIIQFLPHPMIGNYQQFWNTSYLTSFLAVNSHKMELMQMKTDAEVFDMDSVEDVVDIHIHHSYYSMKMKNLKPHMKEHAFS